jgi:hypothetical protein
MALAVGFQDDGVFEFINGRTRAEQFAQTTQQRADRGPVLPPDPVTYNDPHIDWKALPDGSSTYYRRADGRVAMPRQLQGGNAVADDDDGRTRGFATAAPITDAIRNLTKAQRLFLYAMANGAVNKGFAAPEYSEQQMQEMRDEGITVPIGFDTTAIAVAGCSLLRDLPIAWQRWLVSDAAEPLFRPVLGCADGSGALQAGVSALLHWHQYPEAVDGKGRLVGGVVVLGEDMATAVREALNFDFDQVPEHRRAAYDHFKTQVSSELDARILHWWFSSEDHDVRETTTFIDWATFCPSTYEQFFEPAFRLQDSSLITENVKEITKVLYERLPAGLRPGWDTVMGISALPSLRDWAGNRSIDVYSFEVMEQLRDTDYSLFHEDVYETDISDEYDGSDEVYWMELAEGLAAATPDDLEAWWKPNCLYWHPSGTGNLTRLDRRLWWSCHFSWLGFQMNTVRKDFSLPPSPPQ